jgi:hypothetical protein
MFNRPYIAAMVFAALVISPAAPALAAGEILLTHAKALAGNVTPGDAPGYPITLSLPGTYQFAGNVHPTANTIGISIGSDDVTIDLNGFRLHGSTTALFGIAGSTKSVTIKNGTITGFKFDGIFGTGKYWIVDNVRSVENGRDGVVLGTHALVKSSVVAGNIARGIYGRTDTWMIVLPLSVGQHGCCGTLRPERGSYAPNTTGGSKTWTRNMGGARRCCSSQASWLSR